MLKRELSCKASEKLFAIYPGSCLFIRSLNAGPIRLIIKEPFSKKSPSHSTEPAGDPDISRHEMHESC